MLAVVAGSQCLLPNDNSNHHRKTVIRGLHPGSGLTVASLSLDAGCHCHHNTADGGGNLAALLMPAAAALETARHEETLGTMEIIREGGDKAVSAS